MFSFDFLRSGESNCRLFFGPRGVSWLPDFQSWLLVPWSLRVIWLNPYSTSECWRRVPPLCTVIPVRSQRSERNKVHNYVLRVRVRVHEVVYSTWESNRIIMKLEMAAIVGSVPAGNERIIVQKEQERNGRMLAQSSNDVLGFCFSTLFARTAADLVLLC